MINNSPFQLTNYAPNSMVKPNFIPQSNKYELIDKYNKGVMN